MMGLLAIKSKSLPATSEELARYISLIRLFAAFLQTAFPSFFPAIKATRPQGSCSSKLSPSGPFSNLSSTTKVANWLEKRLFDEKMREISALDLMVSNIGAFRRRDACVPSNAFWKAPHGRPGWPYGNGSHGTWRACACWVDRSSSFEQSFVRANRVTSKLYSYSQGKARIFYPADV